MIEIGSIVAEKYRVDRVLGRGGMGMVVAATHVGLGQQVAIKVLLEELLDNTTVVERFLREARASARLRGEHVCRVSDVGTTERGQPYIVMELMAGGDLAAMVAVNGPLPVSAAADFVLQACLGLSEAHALGIVHRDVKPANLFVTERPDGTALVKVLDFGIAMVVEDGEHRLTRTAAMLGSPGYMSPEQLRSSRDVDARSDVWSLGITLFELVTGRPPFSGASISELTLAIAMDPTPPVGVSVPPGFEAVLQGCLAKDPDARFPDVSALAAALAPFAGHGGAALAAGVARIAAGKRRTGPVRLEPAPPAARTPVPAKTTLGSAVMATVDPTRATSRRWPVIAGVAAGLVAVAVLVALATTGSRERAAAPMTGEARVAFTPVDASQRAPDATSVDAIRVSDAAVSDAAVSDAAVSPDASTKPRTPGKRRKKNFDEFRD